MDSLGVFGSVSSVARSVIDRLGPYAVLLAFLLKPVGRSLRYFCILCPVHPEKEPHSERPQFLVEFRFYSKETPGKSASCFDVFLDSRDD